MKLNNKRELQNIAINHSADINSQDFKKIYRECTKQPYNFFDNRYYVTSKWSFKTLKMTITDQIKILNRMIMQNEAQHDLDKKKLLKYLHCPLITWTNINI